MPAAFRLPRRFIFAATLLFHCFTISPYAIRHVFIDAITLMPLRRFDATLIIFVTALLR